MVAPLMLEGEWGIVEVWAWFDSGLAIRNKSHPSQKNVALRISILRGTLSHVPPKLPRPRALIRPFSKITNPSAGAKLF